MASEQDREWNAFIPEERREELGKRPLRSSGIVVWGRMREAHRPELQGVGQFAEQGDHLRRSIFFACSPDIVQDCAFVISPYRLDMYFYARYQMLER